LVRVSIRSWSSVLEVTETLGSTFSRNTDGRTTVGDTICELIDATGLMLSSKTHGVVLSVDCDVFLVAALKLLDGGLNVLHASILAHLLGREVAVKTGSVPVTWDWLRVERNLGTELFGNAVEEESGEPEMITHYN